MKMESNLRHVSMFFLVLLVGVLGSAAFQSAASPQPQVVLPIFNQTALDPNDVYVAASAVTPLPVGARLDLQSDFDLIQSGPVVQLLSGRTYYIGVGFYSFTVYVGDRGVLLIDCGGHFGPGEIDALLDALGSITALPLTHLVYSHPHSDHVGNSVALKRMFPGLEIVASRWADEAIAEFGYAIARPTRLVRQRDGFFIFEGKRFRMVTPALVGHTSADSYVLTPDRVIHAVDIIHPGRLSFIEVSVVQNMSGYLKFLRHLAGERDNYDYFNPGHLNVAYARDVDRTLGYFRDLHAAWWGVVQVLSFQQFVDPNQDNSTVWIRNFFDAVAEQLFFAVAPTYGDIRGVEAARDHAQKVHEHMFLNYLNSNDPGSFGRIPSFEPIPPRR